MAHYGYSGSSFDRWVGEQSLSSGSDNALNKMQHQFWVAKQTILRRLGKKEDECLVAADAELDARLELFLSIQETCSNLHKVVEQYQERLIVLANEENSFGHFLRNNGELDKTRAGKMMNAVGKAMIYSSQQRTALRAPLARLHQEVETFCQRAVEDTSFTVNEMEKCRNDYRGALLWMKNVSQELDPDTFKQLEKFRRVQGHVRSSKGKFDRHKLACLQKIDLLAAARCNMFSHGLIVYQDSMATFWQRTSSALSTVSDAYEGYQPYEFTFVKELKGSSLKLVSEKDEKAAEENAPKYEFFFESEFHDEDKSVKPLEQQQSLEASKNGASNKSRPKSKKKSNPSDSKSTQGKDASADLLGFDFSSGAETESDALLLELASLDFGHPLPPPSTGDLMKGFLLNTNDDDPLLGQEVTSEASFKANFEQVFGSTELSSDDNWNQFLPSRFLTSNQLMGDEPLLNLSDSPPSSKAAPTVNPKESGLKKIQETNIPKKVTSGKDMSTWYNLFADLDPLGNPDALSSTKKEEDDRNC